MRLTRVVSALLGAAAGAAVPTAAIVLQGEGGVQYIPRIVQTPDSACVAEAAANRDSVGKFYLPSTKETKVQIRASTRLDGIFAARCVFTDLVVDTILPDTIAPPPPPPPDPTDSALVRVDVVTTSDTLRIRPNQPYIVFASVAVDSAGSMKDSAMVTLSDTSMAKLWRNKTTRQYEIYTLTTHTKTGPLTVTATYGGAADSTVIQVVATAAPPPPPSDTLPSDTVWTPSPMPDSTVMGKVTWLIGPSRTEQSAKTFGLWGLDSLLQRWENFRWVADSGAHWATNSLWSGANYYDRVQIYYAFYGRTGNPSYLKRGTDIALSYRKDYIEKNNYNHALWWWMPDGLALHYLITGDTMSLRAVGRGTKVLEGYFARMPYPADVNIDGRNRARLMQSYLLSWQLNYPQISPLPWSTYIDSMVNMMERQQRTDGAWVDANRCYTQASFLGAMQAEQLTRIYDHYKPDPRILTMVKKQLDFLWLQVLRPANAPISFAYVDQPCPTNGDYRIPAPDINGFFPQVFAWYGAKTGDRTYIAKADTILRATIQGIYPQGSKQFNQAFTTSWRTLIHLP